MQQILDSRYFLRLLAFAIFAAAWQIYATVAGGFFIPTFVDTVIALADQIVTFEVWEAFAISNVAMLLGFGLAVLIGLPLGLLMGRFRRAEQIANPYVNILIVLPLAGVIPLLLMSTGIGLLSRVIVVWSFAIVMIVVNARVGVRQVDPTLIDMARNFGARELGIWRRVILPGALPAILNGVRIGLGRAITGMVVVELLMVSAGIGGLLLRYQALFQPAYTYALVVLVVLEALVLLFGLDWIQRRITPWAVDFSLRD